MPVGAVVATVGSAAIGASAQSKAAKKSANAVVASNDAATELEREIYYDQRDLLAPSISAGADARARQMLMAGYSPDQVKAFLRSTSSALAYDTPTQGGAPKNVTGGGFFNSQGEWTPSDPGQTIDATPGEDYNWVDDWNYEASSPSYGFRFDEGQRALERSKAAGGDYFSGDTAMALQDYGQRSASQEWEADWRRLGELAGDGTQATGTTVQVAGNFGDSASANARASGQARASGYQQAGNAWSGFWNDTVPGAIGTGYGYGQKRWGWS